MFELKAVIGVVTVVLGLVAYAPYILDTIKGKTRPHIYTWSVSGLVTFVIFLLQITGGGGPGTWVTLTVSLLSLLIAALSFKQADWDITILDTVFLISALISLALWLVIEQPTISMILLVSVGVFGFVPTIRKTWNRPHTETLSTYVINSLRHGLSFSALANYTLLTALFPAAWTMINAAIAVLIVLRRKSNT